MMEFQTICGYVFCFIALYTQVFFLLVAFGKRKEIIEGTILPETVEWPAVTVIVPCWNEGETVAKTIHSLLELDYPKDKLFIKAVDDGSTDNTWEAMQEFQGISNIELIHKENGGKHTAMNAAIATTTTEYVGCLDADAFTAKETLKKTMYQFLTDPELMAVSPTIIVHEPKGLFQKAQEVEYNTFILFKKVLGLLNGIHVTQGPFSVYKKKVFDDLGLYRKAHNTEDLEIAYRMQVNGYKIGQCHDAFVYTVTPDTFKTLYKQRLRWTYGFINNSYDYRKYLLKKKHGTFSIFTVPIGLLSILTSMVMAFFLLWNLGTFLYTSIVKLIMTNFYMGHMGIPHINPFYFDMRPLSLISALLIVSFLMLALLGQKLGGKRAMPRVSFLYFMVIFNLMTPIWFGRAIYNSLVTREMSWR
jgi:cellulose synthase/poly-beta-1,6-N-acetylglucosamine synthase-like glycosyltransferase